MILNKKIKNQKLKLLKFIIIDIKLKICYNIQNSWRLKIMNFLNEIEKELLKINEILRKLYIKCEDKQLVLKLHEKLIEVLDKIRNQQFKK